MVDTAVILAAGYSQRLNPGHEAPPSKPMTPVAGVPLVVRTGSLLAQVGIRRLVVVTGYRAEEVREAVQSDERLRSLELSFPHNPEWRKSNGVSVLAARPRVKKEFLLLMCDHIVCADHLRMMLTEDARPPSAGAVLAVDYNVDRVFDLEDATRVRTDGDLRILDIGKGIHTYDAIDTGVFRSTDGLFPHLETVLGRTGDCSLTDGVRQLAASGRLHARDIGDLWWLDVDTPEALLLAEREFAVEDDLHPRALPRYHPSK